MADGWKVTDNDVSIARDGLFTQARAHGVDLTQPGVADWICHTAEVIAAQAAEARMLRNILHKEVDNRK